MAPTKLQPTKAQLLNQVKQLKAQKGKQNQKPQMTPASVYAPLKSQFAHGICDITNPFCEGAARSKWPDGTSAYTLAIPRRKRVQILTDSQGRAALFLSAGVGGMHDAYFANSYTGSDANFNPETIYSNALSSSLAVDYNPQLPAFAEQARTVSCGFSFTPTLSFMDASGYSTWIEIPAVYRYHASGGSINGLAVDLSLLQRPTYFTSPLRNTNATYIVARPSGPQSREFCQVNTVSQDATTGWSGDFINTCDWSGVVFMAQGPPSTVIGYVDVYQNVECILDIRSTTEVLAPLVSMAPPMNLKLIKASQELTRKSFHHSGNRASVDNSFYRQATSYVSSHLTLDNVKRLAQGAYGLYTRNPSLVASSLLLANTPSNPEEVD